MINRTRASYQSDQMGQLLNPAKQGSASSVNHLQKNRQKLMQAQHDKQQKWEEAKMDKAAQDQLFKMKKFQNVQSKVRNELSERERKDDLKPLAGADDRDQIEDVGGMKGSQGTGVLPPINRRAGVR